MCTVCMEFAERDEAARVRDPYGAVAQLAERFHGMEEVARSIRVSSTTPWEAAAATMACVGAALAGFVAGEGCFMVTRKQPPFRNGDPRLRFVFAVKIARRDRPLLDALGTFLGEGSVRDSPARREGWQPESEYRISSLRGHRAATIPFCERFLVTTHKQHQFELWRQAMDSYESMHPTRYGNGPSPCKICGKPVRGRGLCRSHYYLETGY
jgi:hypothetical protein